jgi:hypothetical protein
MLRSISIAILSILGLAISPQCALAHHSLAAEFDNNDPVSFTGTLTKVDWMNPHIWYYVDVEEEDGSITTWAVTGGAPTQLMRRGIFKDAMQIGEIVEVNGFRAHDGSNNIAGRGVTYADGRGLFTAPAEIDELETP